MRRLGLLLAFVLGCGGIAPNGAGFDFALTVDGVVAENAKGYQVVVLKTSVDCGSILSTCVDANTGIHAGDFVQISDPSGKQEKAVFFANTLVNDSGQEPVSVGGIPPATGYTVVVEAISQSNTLLGSSCDKVSEIHSGSNSLTAFIHPNAVNCDPTIQ